MQCYFPLYRSSISLVHVKTKNLKVAMKSNGNILFMTALVLSMVYFAHRSAATKVLCIWFLALFPKFPGSTAQFNLISWGLLVSSLGDISLEMGRDGPFFIGGLLFFLVAHVLYIFYFFEKPIHIICFLPFAVFVFLLLYVLLPGMPSELRLPVIVYALVIGVMAGMAWSRCMQEGPWDMLRLMGAIGAVVFVASDTIIAVDKFYAPFESAKTWVMITYYSGQTLIAASNHLDVKKSKRKAR